VPPEECADYALCGDPTCESPSCRQSAIDAWFERQEQEAREIVLALLNDGPVACIVDEDGGVCGLGSCPRCGAAPELIDGSEGA
jgi:hypothetical protein